MSDNVFEVANIAYHYDQISALDGVSLAIEAGQRVAIIGANGSGKSTLLKLLDGLYFPESGAIAAFGQPLTQLELRRPEFAQNFRRRVGLVFQNPDVQLFNPTVFDEIAFGPLQLGWEKGEIRRRSGEILELMDLSPLTHRPPHRLSGGEKKRVALASVLVMDPEVLLLDEPTHGLDPKSQSQIIDFLIGWGGGAKTVVTATHHLDVVEDIADYCYILQRGRVMTAGRPSDILDRDDLLKEAGLIHAHSHAHDSGVVHSHPHLHQRHQH
jgi:cobalt/nickel transport system ATP-binding protein